MEKRPRRLRTAREFTLLRARRRGTEAAPVDYPVLVLRLTDDITRCEIELEARNEAGTPVLTVGLLRSPDHTVPMVRLGDHAAKAGGSLSGLAAVILLDHQGNAITFCNDSALEAALAIGRPGHWHFPLGGPGAALLGPGGLRLSFPGGAP